MSKNTKLFQDAIADAKALREVAVANAKAALEESFMPKIQSMFEKRIMDGEDIDEAKDELEEKATYEVDKDVLTKSLDEMDDSYSMEEEGLDLEELFNSLSEDETIDVSDDDSDETYDLEEILRELEEEDSRTYEGEDGLEEDLYENFMDEKAGAHETIDEVTVDELRDMIQDAIRAVMGGEEGSAGEEEITMGAEEGGDELDFTMDAEEETGTEEEKPKKKKSKTDELDELYALYERKKKEKNELDERRKYKGGKNEKELKEAFSKKANAPFGLGGKGKQKPGAPYGAAGTKKSGLNGAYSNKLSMKLHEMEDIEEMNELEELKDAAKKIANEKVKKEKELDEAINVIKTLRSQLNEVNLLNAKLIYVNRLFKENMLTESQKVNVVNSFDKATTLTETKNIYEVLKNTVKTSKATSKTALREHKSFASSVIGGSTAKPEIIDANDQITRMQKLAGIIKN
jgi:hypothetical protein